jgi:predicted Zn-dependent peptidase
MKNLPVRLAALLIASAFVVASCATTPQKCSAPATVQGNSSSPAIVEHPSKLTFPPFDFVPPRAEQYRVQLKSGTVVYVAEDRELPLVNISILVRTGDWVDPDGKEGLADFCGALLTKSGTESRTAQELEERLAFLAANLGSKIEGAQGTVSLNLLSKDIDEGLAILREVLSRPRFQQDRIDLQKRQTMQAMNQRNDDSATIEGFEMGFLAYGEKFWENRHQTAASVESISRDDLMAFHQRWFFPGNFIVAASGDFDRAEMIAKLEKLFSDWPHSGTPPPAVPDDIAMAAPGVYLVDKSVNQGRVSLLLPGIRREDPDLFPVMLMNDILGGSGFSSRLVNRIRSDEGLAYSVGSVFQGGIYFPTAFRAAFQTKSRTVPFATSIVLEEMKRIAAEPVTDAELENSKRSFIDRMPRQFASKAQVVGVFAVDEYTGRFRNDPRYWQEVASRIKAVTKEDVQRVAKKYLTPERLVVLVVGEKEEILKGHPNHAAKMTDFGDGKLVDVPLRDPLTMQPQSKTDAPVSQP